MCARMYVCMYVCMYVQLENAAASIRRTGMRVCVHACMYVCMRVHACMCIGVYPKLMHAFIYYMDT
jgi:hypothetical protein